MDKKNVNAIIIGAGPAGLTAAYELLHRTDIKPIIYEMTNYVGGISRTVNYKGNRIDIGGHRFFSKSNRIMKWWQNILPLEGRVPKGASGIDSITPEKTDKIMLIRKRLSRILYRRKFFNYPILLNLSTISNLGFIKSLKIGLSYIKSRISPIRDEKSLEDFFINRFGRELYLTFFKDYTEKVWGVPCSEIKAEWGIQRVKGLSISKAVLHSIKKISHQKEDIYQKGTETSLIGQFMYPKYGPGQMWEEVAIKVKEKDGKIFLKQKVIGIKPSGNRIVEVEVIDLDSGVIKKVKGDYFFSAMPVKDLIDAFGNEIPHEVQKIAHGLRYRDFITVGLLVKKLKVKNDTKIKTYNDVIPDNWIYIQERDVKISRLQIFNNWSPYLVKDKNTIWLGLEYMCNAGDELWRKSDEELKRFAIDELKTINIIEGDDILDSTVIRMRNVYPAYFGTYERFDVIREFTDRFENLFLIGRSGMHRYNNQDHSMLSAIVAVENIINNVKGKDKIWAVNVEEEYLEERN